LTIGVTPPIAVIAPLAFAVNVAPTPKAPLAYVFEDKAAVLIVLTARTPLVGRLPP
jgi:hypothetical protein